MIVLNYHIRYGKVTNVATGATVSLTGVTNVSSVLNLAGTFVSGQSYYVSGADSGTLFTAGIKGYDLGTALKVTIP